MSTRLELRHISRSFSGYKANDNISMSIDRGEIHALLGENGAGKSTLVKMIYGLLKPDSGQLLWEGKPVRMTNPEQAKKLGIGMVFQHFSLFEGLTVLENIALALPKSIKRSALVAKITEISTRYQLPLQPERLVFTLSAGERQRIEIVRCLLQNPKLLILDEPTSVLTAQEVKNLFRTLRTLQAEGCSILYISHKLSEVQTLCQKATILRKGKVVGSCLPGKETTKSLAQMMIGEKLAQLKTQKENPKGPDYLIVNDLNFKNEDAVGQCLSHINFHVQSGEIIGIAGIAGNGQTELMAVLSGEQKLPLPQTITMLDTPVGHKGPNIRRTLGAVFVPEERIGHASISDMDLMANTILTAEKKRSLSRFGFLNRRKARKLANEIITDYKVRPGTTHARAGSLSGGNLQKFIVGREVKQAPKLIVIEQPTWGVDAGAAQFIHQQLINLTQQGVAILIISQDLDELFALTHRLYIINEGTLSASLNTQETTSSQIGELMGQKGKHHAHHF